MSSNHTANYGLSQWERTDKVLMEDFNADNAKIDAALGGHRETLEQLVKTAGLVPKLGNCQIETFTYTGAGTTEAGKTVPFAKRPVFFMIFGPRYSGALCGFGEGDSAVYLGRYMGSGNNDFYYIPISLTWSGNTAVINQRDASYFMDLAEESYRVVAFRAMDR
ncbi:hypothetical protein AALA83_16815 [Oscillospiraceae bacterium 44-5]